MNSELPINWILIKVVDVSEIVRGITYQKSDASTKKFDNSCLVLRGGNIQDGKIVIEDDCVYVPDSIVKKEQKLSKGDVIIVGSTGSAKLIGKAAFSLSDEDEISFGAFLVMLRPDKKIESRYFDYFFLTEFYRTEIRELAGGININNIRREHLEGIDFPLPPCPEQQRIVAKLDNLFGNLDALKTRLDRIPQLLKDFRQKVLTQAVTGKLTEEWRDGRELEEWNDFEQERLSLQMEAAIKKGQKSFKYKPAVCIDLEGSTKGIDELFELPGKWKWISIDQVVWNVSDGPHFSPSYVEEGKGIRFISGRNISYSGIDFSDAKFVSLEDHNEFIKRGAPEKGDILLTKGGTTGIACIVGDDTIFSYWVHVALLKPIRKIVFPKYLKEALSSSLLYNQSQALTHGVGNQDLGLTRMIYMGLPLPPMEEQQEIVHRVESLFVKADQIEASYQKLKAKIEQLPQALLAKAFRGELVAQLPTDGDARDLLEQIKQAKAGLGKGGKSRKLKADDEVRMVAEGESGYGIR